MDIDDQSLKKILKTQFGKGTKLIHGLAEEVRRGRQMLRAKLRPCVQRPTHVLVTVEPDGQIEIRCESHVRVRIVHLPAMHSAAAADVVEELLLRWLPRPYQELLANHAVHYQGSVQLCPSGQTLLEGLHVREALKRAEGFKETIAKAQTGDTNAA